jgi:leucyl/phenylalanyl-tRNA--protein transferase
VHLVDRLRERGFTLLDSQFANDHVLRLGAEEIPADEYLRRLALAIALDATFG